MMNPFRRIKVWWRTRRALKRIDAEQPVDLIYYSPMLGGEYRRTYPSLTHLKQDLGQVMQNMGTHTAPYAAQCGDDYYDATQLRRWAQECNSNIVATFEYGQKRSKERESK